MREKLFRGMRKDNGEWVEGFLFQTKEHTYIAYAEQFVDDLFLSPKNIFVEVIPETVGQYTGLTDKNGKKIFEGDIVRIDSKNYEVQYLLGQFFVGINMPIAYKRFGCEVIGNIHDNEELSEGGGSDA